MTRGVVVECASTSDAQTVWEYVEHVFIFPKFRVTIDHFNPDAEPLPGLPIKVTLDLITQPFSGFAKTTNYGRYHLNSTPFALTPVEYGLEIPWAWSFVTIEPVQWNTPLGYQ